MASNMYQEVVQVTIRDQTQPALGQIQRNVERAEASFNRISANPFSVIVKVTDMLTRPLASIIQTATSMVTRA